MNQARSILESVETELIGRRGVSFSIAARMQQWKPEPGTAVCWRCAQSVGQYETDGDGCATCRGNKLPWSRAMRLGRYDGIIRDAVLDLKFRRWRLTGKQLGEAFGVEIADRLDALGLRPEEVLISPIPMTRRRRIRRGIDHTLVLAQGVSRSSGIRVVELLRARNRAEQIGLSATDRTKNMRGAFFVPGSSQRRLKKLMKEEIRAILVLDDVRTTGATLEEGCRVLNRAIVEFCGEFRPEIWAGSVALAGDERKGGPAGNGRDELSTKGGEIEQEVDA